MANILWRKLYQFFKKLYAYLEFQYGRLETKYILYRYKKTDDLKKFLERMNERLKKDLSFFEKTFDDLKKKKGRK